MRIKRISLHHFLVILLFFLFSTGLGIACLLTPDQTYSSSERRSLASFPAFSFETAEGYGEELEDYFTDQFVLRDSFRRMKVLAASYLFGQSDVNGYTVQDGSEYEILYPTQTKLVDRTTALLSQLCQRYFGKANLYYSVIRDKGFYAEEELGLDYDAILASFAQNLGEEAEWVDFTDCLTLSDFYKTDIHWRQERLLTVSKRLCEAMGVSAFEEEELTQKNLGAFAGVLYGQAAFPVSKDEMVVLTGEVLENCTLSRPTVEKTETTETTEIYDWEAFLTGEDGYDVFLGGEEPLLVIENPSARTDKKLILFRDSFARSLAPLLVKDYRQIVLVDLRWIRSSALAYFEDLLAADEQTDVLFLYSGQVLNSMLYQ